MPDFNFKIPYQNDFLNFHYGISKLQIENVGFVNSTINHIVNLRINADYTSKQDTLCYN